MNIRKALPSEATMLSRVAAASKAYWGYPDEWLEKWRSDLTITPVFIENNQVFVLVSKKEKIIGFYAVSEENEVLWIEHLWLLPEYIGRGLGRKLFVHALEHLPERRHREWKVIADPNAVPFYEKLGMSIVDRMESWPPGRYLPVLSKRI